MFFAALFSEADEVDVEGMGLAWGDKGLHREEDPVTGCALGDEAEPLCDAVDVHVDREGA